MPTTQFYRFTIVFEGSPGEPRPLRRANQAGTDYFIEQGGGSWKLWENEHPISIALAQHAELDRLLQALRPWPEELDLEDASGEDGTWYTIVVRDGTRYGIDVSEPGQRRGYCWWGQPPPQWAGLEKAADYVQALANIPRQAVAQQNKILATHFFDRLAARDVEGAMECCDEQIEYSNPFFDGVNQRRGLESVASMWRAWLQMLPEARIVCDDIRAGHENGSAHWVLEYTLPNSSRNALQRISADLSFAEGKIIRHRDRFSLHEWASHTYGATGSLLGGRRAFQNWIAARERARLAAFERLGSDENES